MHILFLTDNFPPEFNAPASRTFEHCREWVAAGHQVTVITCAPNFPAGKVFEGYRNRLNQTEQMAGIRVIRVWSYITRNEGFVKRIADYVSFMVMAVLAALFVRKPDVIIGTSPQFFAACAAYLVGLFKRRPWIFELRDLWPESIRAVEAVQQEKLLDWIERLELFLYRRASAVISVTHAFKANLVRRGIGAEKIHVVTNGVDISRFQPRPKDAALQAGLGLTEKFVAGYIGTVGMAHGTETILRAAEILNDQCQTHIRLIILGDGADRAKIEKRAASLPNVILLSSVSKDEVVRYWSLLDTSIIHLRKLDLFKTVIPSKLFECMGMGIPVLHGVVGESADIVERHGFGLIFEPENAAALASAIEKMASDDQLRASFSARGSAAAHEYDRKALAMAMLAVIESTKKQ